MRRSGSSGVAYAVLLAFVVISAYTSYNDAKSGAETEAEAILQLSRTVEAFSPEQIERLEGVLVCYGQRGDPTPGPRWRRGEDSALVNSGGTEFRHLGVQGKSRPTRSSNGSRSGRAAQRTGPANRGGAARGLPRPSAPCPSPWLVLLLGALPDDRLGDSGLEPSWDLPRPGRGRGIGGGDGRLGAVPGLVPGPPLRKMRVEASRRSRWSTRWRSSGRRAVGRARGRSAPCTPEGDPLPSEIWSVPAERSASALDDGAEALLVDSGEIDGGQGTFFANAGDDLHAARSVAADPGRRRRHRDRGGRQPLPSSRGARSAGGAEAGLVPGDGRLAPRQWRLVSPRTG